MDAALKRFAAENGMKMAKGCAYGELGGFLVTLSNQDNLRSLYLNYRAGADVPEENERRGRLDAFLASVKAQGNVLGYNVFSDGVQMSFRGTGKGMASLRALLPQLLGALAQDGFAGTACCSRCGGATDGTEKIVLRDGKAQLMHEACITALADEQREAVQQQSHSGNNYWMGLLGAVLGTLVGLIPWVLIARMGYFASIAGFLIGLCAKKGYELFRGKLGRPKLVALIVCSVLGVVLAQYVDVWIQVAIELDGYFFSFGELTSITTQLILTEPEVLTPFLLNLVLGLVFALAGLWGVFAQTKQEVDMASGKMTVLDRN